MAAAGAAITLAAGALALIPKLKKILGGFQELAARVRSGCGRAGEKVSSLGGGCFLAGTLVAMGDGSFVPIEDVNAGQFVQCEQPAAVAGHEGEDLTRVVTAADGRIYEGAIVTVVVEIGGRIAKVSGTPEHPFWAVSRHQWVPVGELVVGDRLDGRDGDVAVVGREVAFVRVPVFSLSVAGAHSYRVTELGVLVHNTDPCFTSPGQLQKMIDRGQAPRDIVGAHKGIGAFEKDHVHFKDGSALNRDGTVKHGSPNPSNAASEFLEAHGWAGRPTGG